uniref:Uncharacterized protein n=1 Tax=uncultured organism MedDCM-OCT-S08-C169 TaxID=743633 RepID=D6PJ53_9ZZZZ|nr:hypothetical protein [uncultured organism MedDCM-OCT-S08-C169]
MKYKIKAEYYQFVALLEQLDESLRRVPVRCGELLMSDGENDPVGFPECTFELVGRPAEWALEIHDSTSTSENGGSSAILFSA